MKAPNRIYISKLLLSGAEILDKPVSDTDVEYIRVDVLRAEIERRLKNTRDYMNGAGMKYKGPKYHASRGRESAYDAILSFLSTLKEPVSEAVEGTIDDCGTPARLRLEMPGGSFRIGDKVRVIVLPKEDRL